MARRLGIVRDQEGRDGGVSAANGDGEGGAAVVVGVVHGGARLEEELGEVVMPVDGRATEGSAAVVGGLVNNSQLFEHTVFQGREC